MSKSRSRRPASETRVARRSLVELTAAASRAVNDGLQDISAGPAASFPEPPSRLAVVVDTPVPQRLERRDGADQAAAPAPVAGNRSIQAPSASACDDSTSAAAMVVQIAKDYQGRVLDDIKAGLHAALDHAKDFAETPARGEDGGAAPDKNRLIALAGTTAALKFMQANVATALDYARELAGVRTAAEFVELSGTQARRQCELMLKQADALKSLAQAASRRGGE